MPPGVEKPKSSPPLVVEQPDPEDYEDYDDQYVDPYSSAKTSMLHQKMQDIHLEDDLPDTTMLDSVVLPAIASVSSIPNINNPIFAHTFYVVIPQGFLTRSSGSAQRSTKGVYRSRAHHSWSHT
jgi:hypothetical protein